MGKSRNKERTEEEYLRGKLRELQSENRQLKKQLNKFKKLEHIFDQEDERYQDEDLVTKFAETVTKKIVKNNLCPECKDGILKTVDLGVRKLTTCNVCKFRRTEK